MTARPRSTVPLETKVGLLETYEAQESELLAAELRGRTWCFEQALQSRPLSDSVVFDLHLVMFEPLFEWAGQPRPGAFGPGGIEHVRHGDIRSELRKLGDDFAMWRIALDDASPVEHYAHLVADAHHRFQWIHPFRDTNGRTGRVLDHFILWSCFGLRGDSRETSPNLVYAPSDDVLRKSYFDGLADADNGRPDRLRAYYEERLRFSLSDV